MRCSSSLNVYELLPDDNLFASKRQSVLELFCPHRADKLVTGVDAVVSVLRGYMLDCGGDDTRAAHDLSISWLGLECNAFGLDDERYICNGVAKVRGIVPPAGVKSEYALMILGQITDKYPRIRVSNSCVS